MDKTKRVIELAQKKSKETKEIVLKAIEEMKRKGLTINYNSVHKYTGVSKTTLYKNKELRDIIENLRINLTDSQLKQRNAIAICKTRIKILEEENFRLKEKCKDANIDVVMKENELLKKENEELKVENTQLLNKIYENIN